MMIIPNTLSPLLSYSASSGSVAVRYGTKGEKLLLRSVASGLEKHALLAGYYCSDLC